MTDEPRRGLDRILHSSFLPAKIFGGRVRTSTLVLCILWVVLYTLYTYLNPVEEVVQGRRAGSRAHPGSAPSGDHAADIGDRDDDRVDVGDGHDHRDDARADPAGDDAHRDQSGDVDPDVAVRDSQPVPASADGHTADHVFRPDDVGDTAEWAMTSARRSIWSLFDNV